MFTRVVQTGSFTGAAKLLGMPKSSVSRKVSELEDRVAGWSAGQLEQEIAQNAWLTVLADADVLFDTPAEARLPAAMRLLGIDFSRLSDAVGHA